MNTSEDTAFVAIDDAQFESITDEYSGGRTSVLDGPNCVSPKTPLKKPKRCATPDAPRPQKKKVSVIPTPAATRRLDFGVSARTECMVCHIPETRDFRVMTYFGIFDICHHCALHAVGVAFNHPKFIEIVGKRKELYEFRQRNVHDINKFAENLLEHEINTLYFSYRFKE
jgi:hypothetical protein